MVPCQSIMRDEMGRFIFTQASISHQGIRFLIIQYPLKDPEEITGDQTLICDTDSSPHDTLRGPSLSGEKILPDHFLLTQTSR